MKQTRHAPRAHRFAQAARSRSTRALALAALAAAALGAAAADGNDTPAAPAPTAATSAAGSGPAGAAPAGRTPLARLGDETWYVDDVAGAVAFRIYRMQVDIYSLLKQETEQRVDRVLLEREAARRGVDVDTLIASVEGEAAPVSDAEVDAYLAAHPREGRATPEEVRARVRHYLGERRRLEGRIALVEGLRKAAGYRFVLTPPEVPRTEIDVAGAPARGPADAPLVIVHFASFSSRNSGRSAAKIARLVREFPGRIREVHRNWIRDRDEIGLRAAQLGFAAQERGRFWPLHDAWFAHEGPLDRATLDAIAQRTGGLDEADIAAATTDTALLERVRNDMTAANTAGVPREPTLFVNGRYVSGTTAWDELRAIVASELDAAMADASRANGVAEATPERD